MMAAAMVSKNNERDSGTMASIESGAIHNQLKLCGCVR
jgi:hypothetical protein